jgi:IS30 family transposase
LEAQAVRQAIIRVLHKLPPVFRRSATFDRGGEFAEVHQLEKHFGIVNYFCDAYSAWQKGSVENQNKEVRRHIPKGTDLATVTAEQLAKVASLLNSKPRPSLGGLTASDSWYLALRRHRSELH